MLSNSHGGYQAASGSQPAREEGSSSVGEYFSWYTVMVHNFFDQQSGNRGSRLVSHWKNLRPFSEIIHEDDSILVSSS